jgi:ArsR family transcriptional regulator
MIGPRGQKFPPKDRLCSTDAGRQIATSGRIDEANGGELNEENQRANDAASSGVARCGDMTGNGSTTDSDPAGELSSENGGAVNRLENEQHLKNSRDPLPGDACGQMSAQRDRIVAPLAAGRSDPQPQRKPNMLTNVENSVGATKEQMPELTEHLEKELVQVFKLLSDETRLRILNYLGREGELHVTALCDKLGQSQPAVSHHLALLRVAGLIEARRDGKHNFYSIRSQHVSQLLREVMNVFGDERKTLTIGEFTLSQNS